MKKKEEIPTLQLETAGGKSIAVAKGVWRAQQLAESRTASRLESDVAGFSGNDGIVWDLTRLDALDYVGAFIFWNGWGKKIPENLKATEGQRMFFSVLEENRELKPAPDKGFSWDLDKWLKDCLTNAQSHITGAVEMLGQLLLDFFHLACAPHRGPWKEISANIYHAGTQALGIIALVAFLIGVVLSYLSAQQLHMFGGDIFLVNLLGMAVIRELGPLLAAILVAGRSGSSMTAQIGVMRVTEELDAMKVMGLPHSFRLVLPKVIAMGIVMPLLIIWTDIVALLGGFMAGSYEIGLSLTYCIVALPGAVPVANFWIGIGKGVAFGVLIALIACHYGLRIKPNTESLGAGTTASVVTSITSVILADAVFAILLTGVGF